MKTGGNTAVSKTANDSSSWSDSDNNYNNLTTIYATTPTIVVVVELRSNSTTITVENVYQCLFFRIENL